MAEVHFSSDVESENPLSGVTVPLDDQVFRCEGRLSILELSELAAMALGRKTADAAEAAAIYQTFFLAFGEDEYERFKEHARKRKTPDEVLLKILQYLNEKVQANIEAIAGRPTRPSSSSPPGLEGKADLPVRSVSLSRAKLGPDGDTDTAKPRKTPKPRAASRARTGGTARTPARRTG
jgi:hypothetical protein